MTPVAAYGPLFGEGLGITQTNRRRSKDSTRSTPAGMLPSLTNTAKPFTNIAEQVKDHSYRKSILIIGAGHVISVKEMLKQVYPELHVVLMYDAE